MPAFDDYTPEELEPRARELTSQLEQIYQQQNPVAPTIPAREQDAILARARTRLTDAATRAATQQDARPPLVLLDFASATGEAEDAYPSLTSFDLSESENPAPLDLKKRRRSRFSQLINAIAAILVVALLITGSVALFTHHASLTGGPAAQTTTPPPASCFLTSPSDIASGISYPDLSAVCQQHLYQDLHIVGTNGQFRATLVRAYADRIRVVTQMELEHLVNGLYVPIVLGDTASTVENVQTSQGQALWAFTGASEGHEEVDWFTAPPLLMPATTLHLHLNLRITDINNTKGTGISQWPVISFDFSLPLHPELRTIVLNKTVNINGQPMTIKNMYLSPSEALFEIAYDPGHTDMPGADLTIGKTACLDRNKGPDIMNFIGPSTIIVFGCSLYTAHGPAHLVLKNLHNDQVLGTFDFTVPAL